MSAVAQLVQVAPLIAAGATIIGTAATFAAVYAALKTARKADDTSVRASAALGRTARPSVRVLLRTIPAGTTAEPEPFDYTFELYNAHDQFAASNVWLEVTRADDGAEVPEVRGPVALLGPGQSSEPFTISVPYPYGHPKPGIAGAYGGEILWVTVQYEDRDRLLIWRETVGRVYSGRTSSDPEDRNLTVMWQYEKSGPREVAGPEVRRESRRRRIWKVLRNRA